MTDSSAAQALLGRRVVVTRPVHQADNLARLIVEAGGEPVRFPALAIEPPADSSQVRDLLASVGSFDLAVFISANAVDHAFALLRGPWPTSVPVSAVGEGTAAALRRRGLSTVIVPSLGTDSESLLAVPLLKNARGKRVLIVRGEGGRELLAQELRRRGAEVTYAQCYRRVLPQTDSAPLIARWARGELHAVTVMSGATLDNLWVLLEPGGRDLLRTTPVFVSHPGVADRARQLGLVETVVTPPGDEGMLRGLSEWFSSRTR